MDIKLYRCEHCGNIAIKVVDSRVPLNCCGQKMVELVPGTVDAAIEKHVPFVELNGRDVCVRVGEVAHPMTEEHLIEFVVLVTKDGYQIVRLDADDAPEARFALAEGDEAVKVYEYCNLHGLWVKEL